MYHEIINERALGYVKDLLNIARYGARAGDLHLAVQHAKDGEELRIFDNLERTMAPADPQRQGKTEAFLAIGRAVSKVFDTRCGWSEFAVAPPDMPHEV